jgi:hypothetical protein
MKRNWTAMLMPAAWHLSCGPTANTISCLMMLRMKPVVGYICTSAQIKSYLPNIHIKSYLPNIIVLTCFASPIKEEI